MNKKQSEVFSANTQSVISGFTVLKFILLKIMAQYLSALINRARVIAFNGKNKCTVFRAKGISGTGFVPAV